MSLYSFPTNPHFRSLTLQQNPLSPREDVSRLFLSGLSFGWFVRLGLSLALALALVLVLVYMIYERLSVQYLQTLIFFFSFSILPLKIYHITPDENKGLKTPQRLSWK
ncbi:hypothetical protein BDV06DRAFT_38443 [Aspergillus oleicola]